MISSDLLEERVTFLMERIQERIRLRNNIYRNEDDPLIINIIQRQDERLKTILLNFYNRLKREQDNMENIRVISEVERNTNEDENGTASFNEEDVNSWWEREEKNFLQGEYKIVYSNYGIEKILRKANIDGKQEFISEDKKINGIETFNNDTCVLCLDENKIPNILFCNCGHICLCEKCNIIYKEYKCPLCKIENTIKRKINNIK